MLRWDLMKKSDDDKIRNREDRLLQLYAARNVSTEKQCSEVCHSFPNLILSI